MGVMGKNLALNIASKGHSISIYNRDYVKTQEIISQSVKENLDKVHGYERLDSFVDSLEKPRKVIIMVKAGDAVDDVLRNIGQYIDKDDIVIDGGNEWYERTEKRQMHMYDTYGAYLLGMGVSGGAEGARYGPSLMPSGNVYAFEHVRPILESIAAKTKDDITCMTYVGTGGSGNYVKMVHNGIEYGIMQVIAEVYTIMKRCMGYTNDDIATFFENCNIDIQSYLLEITIAILREKEGDEYVLDKIIDSPKMNGTGTWTSKDGYEMQVAIPSIHSAVDARIISSKKELRMKLGEVYASYDTFDSVNTFYGRIKNDDIQKAMTACMFLCYVQGFQLIQEKNFEKKWGVHLQDMANIWKGGCIIRSRILDFFSDIDDEADIIEKSLTSLWVHESLPNISKVITSCSLNYVPTPIISSSFQYILQHTQKKDSSNLIQAQRHYFGAHGYERYDDVI